MPKSKTELEEIEADILAAIGTPSIRIDANNPIAIVHAPVDIGLGAFPKDFIPVSKLVNMDDLPFIPERKRDFAFRFATEYKRYADWAEIYGVTAWAIWSWVHDPKVSQYIAATRYETRNYNFAQSVIMQRLVVETIRDIMNMKKTADNLPIIADMAKFMYKVLTDPQSLNNKTLNVINNTVNAGPRDITQTPYKISAPVNATLREMDEIADELKQLRQLADEYGVEL